MKSLPKPWRLSLMTPALFFAPCCIFLAFLDTSFQSTRQFSRCQSHRSQWSPVHLRCLRQAGQLRFPFLLSPRTIQHSFLPRHLSRSGPPFLPRPPPSQSKHRVSRVLLSLSLCFFRPGSPAVGRSHPPTNTPPPLSLSWVSHPSEDLMALSEADLVTNFLHGQVAHLSLPMMECAAFLPFPTPLPPSTSNFPQFS